MNCDLNFDPLPPPLLLSQLWTPPTPPQDDNDIYIDSVMMLMYDTAPMPESKLPPVYVRKEHKRLKMDPAGGRRPRPRPGATSCLSYACVNVNMFFFPARSSQEEEERPRRDGHPAALAVREG